MQGHQENILNTDAFTQLCLAAEKGNLSIVSNLLSECAIVSLLLTVPGIDISRHDNHGRPPLSVAALCGRSTVILLLLAVPGIDIHKANKLGLTSLSAATQNDHSTVVSLLLDTIASM